jgi:peroxiredoxin
MKQRSLRAGVGAALALAWATAAQAQLLPQIGTEWRYAGEARRIVGSEAPTTQRLTGWATVVGQENGTREVVRYRHLPDWPRVIHQAAVWRTATDQENSTLPTEFWISPEVRMVDALTLPVPFGRELEPGESPLVRVPLLGYALPFPQTLPVRRRVLGEETVEGRLCLRVERKLVAPLPLITRSLRILAYRDQLWVERGSGVLVRFEGSARVQEEGPEGPVTTLSTALRLVEAQSLSVDDLRLRREHGAELTAIVDLLRVLPGEPSEGRLREALRRAESFERDRPDSPYTAAVPSLKALAVAVMGARLPEEWWNARRRRPQLRVPPPAIRLKDLEGNERTLEEFRGKTILLHAFASWSPESHQQAEYIEKEYWQRYRDRGLVVIGLNTAELSDPVQKARSFRDQHTLTYPILVDTDGAVRRALRIHVLPTTLMVDEEGILRYFEPGFNQPIINITMKALYPPQQ